MLTKNILYDIDLVEKFPLLSSYIKCFENTSYSHGKHPLPSRKSGVDIHTEAENVSL